MELCPVMDWWPVEGCSPSLGMDSPDDHWESLQHHHAEQDQAAINRRWMTLTKWSHFTNWDFQDWVALKVCQFDHAVALRLGVRFFSSSRNSPSCNTFWKFGWCNEILFRWMETIDGNMATALLNICTVFVVPEQVSTTILVFRTAVTWDVLMYLGMICHSASLVIHMDLRWLGVFIL